MIQPKAGDWVKLVNKRPAGWNTTGAMDKFLGMTVEVIYSHAYTDGSGNGTFNFKENDKCWAFQWNNIESLENGPTPVINNNYSIT